MSQEHLKLRVLPAKEPIRVESKREPVEMSQGTCDNLWRVMLENAQERGGSGDERNVFFYRRRLRFSPIWVPVGLGLVLVFLAIGKAVL